MKFDILPKYYSHEDWQFARLPLKNDDWITKLQTR